jgi:DNA-binding transcriptional ArsR family regulator
MNRKKKGFSKIYAYWPRILNALADETRLKIVLKLLYQELSVNRLADILGMKEYNISRHLKILETNGLIEKRKEGNYRFYNVSEKLKLRLSDNCLVLDLGCCKFRFTDIRK